MKTKLVLRFVDRKRATAAVKWWHYSKTMPSGENHYVGAWENDRFIGVVIFGRGATPNIGSPWKLEQHEVCELVRVALAKHDTPTSRVVAIAIRLMRKKAPALRMMVSYADMEQNHVGTLYQAGGWLYLGSKEQQYIRLHGKIVHPRTLHSLGKGGQSIAMLRKLVDPRAERVRRRPKHKYVLPFDREIEAMVREESLPYPKAEHAHAGVASPSIPTTEGRSTRPVRSVER